MDAAQSRVTDPVDAGYTPGFHTEIECMKDSAEQAGGAWSGDTCGAGYKRPDHDKWQEISHESGNLLQQDLSRLIAVTAISRKGPVARKIAEWALMAGSRVKKGDPTAQATSNARVLTAVGRFIAEKRQDRPCIYHLDSDDTPHDWWPLVRNQGTGNTCSAHVVSSLLELIGNRESESRSFWQERTVGPKHVHFDGASRLFLHQVAALIDTRGRAINPKTGRLKPGELARGRSISDVLKVLLRHGVPPEDFWPYPAADVSDQPPTLELVSRKAGLVDEPSGAKDGNAEPVLSGLAAALLGMVLPPAPEAATDDGAEPVLGGLTAALLGTALPPSKAANDVGRSGSDPRKAVTLVKTLPPPKAAQDDGGPRFEDQPTAFIFKVAEAFKTVQLFRIDHPDDLPALVPTDPRDRDRLVKELLKILRTEKAVDEECLEEFLDSEKLLEAFPETELEEILTSGKARGGERLETFLETKKRLEANPDRELLLILMKTTLLLYGLPLTAGLLGYPRKIAGKNIASTATDGEVAWPNEEGRRGVIPLPDEQDEVANDSGHAILIVGFDDSKEIVHPRSGKTTRGAFLFQNSWGEDWGEDGFGWLPYDYIRRGRPHEWCIEDVWTLSRTRFEKLGETDEAALAVRELAAGGALSQAELKELKHFAKEDTPSVLAFIRNLFRRKSDDATSTASGNEYKGDSHG